MKKLLQITLLLAGLAWCVPAQATIAFVTSAGAVCGATATCAVTISPAAGDLVIVDVLSRSSPATAPTVATDNTGDTFTSAYVSTNFSTSFFQEESYNCKVSSGTTTITAHNATSPLATSVIVTEYSGQDASSASACLDAVSTRATGTGTTATAGTASPTAGLNEVITGQFEQVVNSTNTWGTSGSYANRANQADGSTGSVLGVNSQLVTSTSGTFAATGALTASRAWGAYTSTYKAAAAGGTFRTQIGGFLVGP